MTSQLTTSQYPNEQNTTKQNAANQEVLTYELFVVGGKNFDIYQPADDFEEVGSEYRKLINFTVPRNFRPIIAFLLKNELQHLKENDNSFNFTEYAFWEIPCTAEFMDCDQGDFKNVFEGAQQQFTGAEKKLKLPGASRGVSSICIEENILYSFAYPAASGGVSERTDSMNEAEEKINRRLESLHLNESTVHLGKSVQLGCILSKQDAIGFACLLQSPLMVKLKP
jgi:hypothetical protein